METIPVSAPIRFFSPAETARRLGTSVKALRLYEARGLVRPVRTGAGWRTYGPEQFARLHQIAALKSLGLSLARIGALLAGREAGLDAVLAVQERALETAQAEAASALARVRAARAAIAAGWSLSVDDLADLTKETTTVTRPLTDDEWRDTFQPLYDKHFTPEEMAAFKVRAAEPGFDQAAVSATWDGLIAEAKRLMAAGDPTTPEALDLARRWRDQVNAFTQGDPETARKVGALWKDAMADPARAQSLPMNPELFAFMGRAQAALAEREAGRS